MALIRDIRLDMGQLQDQQAYADVQFSVEFSERELQRNLQYGLYAGLFTGDDRSINTEFENNGAYQTYLMSGYMPFSMGQDWGMPGFTSNGQAFGMPNSGQMGAFSNPNHTAPGAWMSPEGATGFVCWIAREALQPAGTRTHHVERRVTFDFARMPYRGAAYRALVWALPEITQGQASSYPQRAGGQFYRPFQVPSL